MNNKLIMLILLMFLTVSISYGQHAGLKGRSI
jgi:hypothetical protein